MRGPLAVMIVTVIAGCGDDGGKQKSDAAVDSLLAGCTPGTQPYATVYLNFTGATYMPAGVGAAEDATMNKSNVLDMMRTLPTWPHQNAPAIKTCVQAALKPFRITVVDADPGTEPHHEIVLTDQYWGPGGTGVQSVSASACSGITNSVTFVFGNALGDNVQVACDSAVSQFATASAYLDHTTDCHDYLGLYQTACGPRMWVETPVTCGETTARACLCGGTHQSSLMKMLDKYGASCAP